MERRRIKGVFIPKDIWYDNQLSLIERCILGEIKDTQEEIHYCVEPSKICVVNGSRITNKYLAKFAGVSERSVTTILAKLEELNYIIIKNGNGSQRIIIYGAEEFDTTTTQNFLGREENSKKIKKVTQKNKKIVSKKVNKKNIFLLEAPAYTHEEKRLETYEEVLDGLEVHGIYRMSVFDFIKHLQANGCKVINSRLESLILALDRRYRADDISKCTEIRTAIINGYKRLPCEELN